jgi:hypothetical protein
VSCTDLRYINSLRHAPPTMLKSPMENSTLPSMVASISPTPRNVSPLQYVACRLCLHKTAESLTDQPEQPESFGKPTVLHQLSSVPHPSPNDHKGIDSVQLCVRCLGRRVRHSLVGRDYPFQVDLPRSKPTRQVLRRPVLCQLDEPATWT